MVTGSYDGTLRLWDLKTGVVLKKMEGHRSRVRALAVSPDGEWIASGDESGELIIWHGKTGEPFNQAINKAHDSWIFSLDFSSDSRMLASGSSDTTTKLWSTSSWQVHHTLSCSGIVRCVQYAPRPRYSQALLAIATDCNVQIYQNYTSDRSNSGYHRWNRTQLPSQLPPSPPPPPPPPPPFPTQLLQTIWGEFNYSLAWTPDGTQLLLGGNGVDPTIRAWDTLTWQQVDGPWMGHFKTIHAISLNSSGTFLASASHDNCVRLWRLSDRRNIAIFKHSGELNCVTFSAGDKHTSSVEVRIKRSRSGQYPRMLCQRMVQLMAS
ncbi:WD40-repeat-containing domain protein [Suillus plorans]|uniref:WD40-repeat-containing domain protein n=1 Tax=Suillus plorans TaxID=116603 RepID=A0A9P7DP97_9AGAM|nr:WD40-repeat-containing domain protein [Suillus plorans]KAG1799711.1 WD40-repeat-containing domain protein [Suillus plorans]